MRYVSQIRIGIKRNALAAIWLVEKTFRTKPIHAGLRVAVVVPGRPSKCKRWAYSHIRPQRPSSRTKLVPHLFWRKKCTLAPCARKLLPSVASVKSAIMELPENPYVPSQVPVKKPAENIQERTDDASMVLHENNDVWRGTSRTGRG